MAGHTVITFLCECSGDCIAVCPVSCISKHDRMVAIDQMRCIDCGACSSVCPIEGAVIDYRAHTAQQSPGGAGTGEAFDIASSQRLLREVYLLSRYDPRVKGRVAFWTCECAENVSEFMQDLPERFVNEAIGAAQEYARAMFDWGTESYWARLQVRKPNASNRAELDVARRLSEAWGEKFQSLSCSTADRAAALAMRAVRAACDASPAAADFAIQAVEARQAAARACRTSRTPEAELRWQFDRLLACIAPAVERRGPGLVSQ